MNHRNHCLLTMNFFITFIKHDNTSINKSLRGHNKIHPRNIKRFWIVYFRINILQCRDFKYIEKKRL
jgi:hypothetical protein